MLTFEKFKLSCLSLRPQEVVDAVLLRGRDVDVFVSPLRLWFATASLMIVAIILLALKLEVLDEVGEIRLVCILRVNE